ncbi:hypothetical protein P7K49_012890, partial [Saguinus oedipus]
NRPRGLLALCCKPQRMPVAPWCGAAVAAGSPSLGAVPGSSCSPPCTHITTLA